MVESGKPRASGDPAYVAAYAIAVVHEVASFEDAYALSILVLRRAGGPIATGKNFHLRKARRLNDLGLVELTATLPETWDLSINARLLDVLRDQSEAEVVAYDTRVKHLTRFGSRWYVLATADGVNLVLDNL
jgi:hypothetical protein